MKISDSFVLLQAQSRHQATEFAWQTLSNAGPPEGVNFLTTGPSFQDFLTGQLQMPVEQQLSTSPVISAHFASDESMRLMREISGHRENFSLLAEFPSIKNADLSTFRRQQTSHSFMSSSHFLSWSSNGLFMGGNTWAGRYRVSFQQQEVPRPGVVFSSGGASRGTGGLGRRTATSQQIVRHEWRVRQEKQELQFAALGSVTTEDGRNITFNVDQQYNQSVTELTSGTSYFMPRPLIDPLVLDLNGQGVGFSNETIDFDLNGDGVLDRFSCLDDGCGFLAYDSNGDGCVTNGLELFGIVSGSGFAELAAFDEDGNYWIDENDAIYNDLSIWTPTSDGNPLLQSLQDADVGAICLANADSSFEIVGDDGELQGQISGSGVYLTESGGVEAVHQVDIAVQENGEEALPSEIEKTVDENSEESEVLVA